MGCPVCAIPALLTRMSILPVRSSTDSTRRFAAASSVRSAKNASTRCPFGSSSLARSWMRSVVELIATHAPAACSLRATAKPIPCALPVPVTSAVCPLNSIGIPCELFFSQVYRRFDCAFSARHLEQFRVELHEGMFHGGVLFVALPALVLPRCYGAGVLGIGAEAEIRPRVGKALLVFDLDGQSFQVFLIGTMLVDRSVRGRAIFLQHEDRFVRPLAVGQEIFVGRRIHEAVGRRGVLGVFCARAVAHA